MSSNQALQSQAVRKAASTPMDKKLLLLGLNLLSKGLKVPLVMQPPAKASPQGSPEHQLTDSEEHHELSPDSTQQPTNTSRKRKRDSNNDLSEVEKREKRYFVCFWL